MLTASDVKNVKKRPKPYKLSDERGLYLLVRPNGSRWWRFKYQRPGTRKENLLSLGTYPDVSLKRAREKRDEARRLLADGIDPAAKRKIEAIAAADTFEAIAREWYAKNASQWVPSHGDRIIRRLERDVFPWVGARPISSLTAADVLAVLRRIESRTAIETAHRALQNCGQVFRYAVATARATADVTRDLRGALRPISKRHFAAITNPDELGELLRAIDGYHGTLPVCSALKLAPLVFVRPGELRKAEWTEFDLDAAEWNIPAQRRKLKKSLKNDPATPSHCVPLAAQAIAILRELLPLTGDGRFVFPGARDRHKRPMSDAALTSALRRLGYDSNAMTPHGFRAVARTILDEGLGFRPDFIEHQLGHSVRDPNGRAYNRTRHLDARREMMQAWADYLDGLRNPTLEHTPPAHIDRQALTEGKPKQVTQDAPGETQQSVGEVDPDDERLTLRGMETPETAAMSALDEVEEAFAAAMGNKVPHDMRVPELFQTLLTNEKFNSIDPDVIAEEANAISGSVVAHYLKVVPATKNSKTDGLVGIFVGCAFCAASVRAFREGKEQLAWTYAIDATRLSARLWAGWHGASNDRRERSRNGAKALHEPDHERMERAIKEWAESNRTKSSFQAEWAKKNGGSPRTLDRWLPKKKKDG